ncbi:MAG: hypothetical protein JXX29_11415 [Deltaproteobacteria bacterium]|nr:hypothetical protein [Deltaproteobacteria bacterium]MBN2672280.1 hypothetical protein [Deltaproteobacteria bacterium]
MRHANFRIQMSIAVLCGILFVAQAAFSVEKVVPGDVYRILLKKTGTKAKGEQIVLQIRPKGGVHCNLEYPWKVTLKTPTSMSEHVQTVWKQENTAVFTNELVQFDIAVPSAFYGTKVTFEIKMSMCDDKQCYMKKAVVDI